MTKIVSAINAMISHPEKITEVQESKRDRHNEYFFLYLNKHKWSVWKRFEGDAEYVLNYYPGEDSLAELAGTEGYAGPEPTVAYSTDDFKTKEARDIRDLMLKKLVAIYEKKKDERKAKYYKSMIGKN